MPEQADEKPEGQKPEDTKPLGVSETIAAMRHGLADAAEVKDEEKDDDKAGAGDGGEAGAGAGEATKGAEAGEAESEGEGEGGEAGEGAKGGEREGEEGAGAAGGEEVIEIPGRRQGEEPIKLAVEDKETADRVRQAIRGGLRRDELHREREGIQQQREELDLLEQHLEIDPIGFLAERIRPEIQVDLAKHLLSVPEVFAAVSQELEEWAADENVRGRRQAELGKARADARRGAEAEFGRIRAVKEQGRMVRNTVEVVTPIDMDDDEAVLFQNDCLGDVVHWARANPEARRLRPEEIVTILEKRLRYHGVKPESALAALSSGQPFRRAAAARPKKGASAPGNPDLEAARTTGAKLREAGKARRDAAAVPGAGAGAQVTKLQPPPKQGVKDRINWLRKKLAGQ